jgi:serine/threonine protein phosphatase PrpC
MTIENNSIIVCKKSMNNYAIIEFHNYNIGYYLQKDPHKDVCEDAILIRFKNDNLMLAVCDGVGGSDRSYRAAKNTLSSLNELPLGINQDDLQQELLNINKKLMTLEGEPQTTLTLIVIHKNEYTCFQVGDSGVVHCSNHGNLKYKSISHSPVGEALEAGEINEQQALKHPELHIVNNVLGCANCYIDISDHKELAINDTVLLTSDGLLDNFLTQDLINCIRHSDINQACFNLTSCAKLQKDIQNNTDFNKIDDISFICLKQYSN